MSNPKVVGLSVRLLSRNLKGGFGSKAAGHLETTHYGRRSLEG